MTKAFVTGTGKTIEIGRELGKGGEGSVYEVPANHHWVAKIYNAHHLPDALKQAKLRYMASKSDAELLLYSAWPQDTLHRTTNGPVVGFLMLKVNGCVPIHILYSPAHRRQDYPNVAWDFLLFTARNTAAAFDTIHRHGHVLGDVNQGNVLVGADSKVILIDTDSYQIRTNGSTHLCKVGVAHFTPPELQGVSSFDKVPRSSNHDNFGLALLIFHLLFGGRHPYSGVPLWADAGEALERDIQAFRYAYARDCQQRGFNPPPKSIPISVVPDSIQSMFTAAFTENGAMMRRPTAQEWVNALDGIRGKLRRCSSTSMHVYPGHLAKCPWCMLGNQGVIYFPDVQVGVISSVSNSFVLSRVWAEIEAVPTPPSIIIPDIDHITVTPTPLPPDIKPDRITIFLCIILAFVALTILVVFPGLWFIVLGVVWWGCLKVGSNIGTELQAEKAKRKSARDAARQAYDKIVEEVQHEIRPNIIIDKKMKLATLRNEYLHLSDREKLEIEKLHTTAEARQKQQYLDRQFIDNAAISGVGPAKKAALRSFGIETAADVTWPKVIAVKGFGEVLTRAVVDWRKACERRFVFNPHQAVSESDKNAVRSKIAARRRTIEISLTSGVKELNQWHKNITYNINYLTPQLHKACQSLAQAEADLKVFLLGV